MCSTAELRHARTSGVAYMLRLACFSVYLALFLSWDLQGNSAFTLARKHSIMGRAYERAQMPRQDNS